MFQKTQIDLPTVVRVKAGALDRVGLYLRRCGLKKVAVLQSHALAAPLPQRCAVSLREHEIATVAWLEVADISIESVVPLFAQLPPQASAIIGLGGGKALDVAKYVATLARLPYFAIPTSLSNDGFCSPQSSLTVAGKRRSLPASIPYGLVVDTDVCRAAPRILTLSGVGDLVAKFTAVRDWKLAFHALGEPVNDFAALLSDGSVHAYLSHPQFDTDGMQLLATALMMNGLAMVMSGSSRPASGSEHLISHSLDLISAEPRLHGLQVGVASYLISLLQGENSERICRLFETTGFWQAIREDPFRRAEWHEALSMAPKQKESFYTILSTPDAIARGQQLLTSDPYLAACFA